MRRAVRLCKLLACACMGFALLAGMPQSLAETKNPSGERKGTTWEVRWSGELKNVMMKGDLKGTIALEPLTKLPHLYAVGALEGLQGEVTILDSTASIARVKGGKVAVDGVPKGKASVLVYSQVKRWKELPLPRSARSLEGIEEAVVAAARKAGINVGRPFPFLVKGKVAEAAYHVLRHPGAGTDPHDVHDRARVKFVLKNAPAELVGFYSDKHLGIFTCGGNLHVHLRSADGKVSGHLEEITLGEENRLFLPDLEAR